MPRHLLTFLTLTLIAAPAAAQPRIVLPPPKNGALDNLSLVAAHQSSFVALSDMHNMLAFCHDHTFADAHVSLVKLDAKGIPAAYNIALKLPRPDSLAKTPTYALGAAFHPKLPLLYVWQDILLGYTNPPAKEPPDLGKFDHLAIYNIAKETPELVTTLCRGTTDYIYGQRGGAVAVDSSGSYLYIPNMREQKNAGSLRLGRFNLDADGLPIFDEKAVKEPLPVRIKKLTDANATKPLVPPDLTPIEYVNIFNITSYGAGICYIPVGKEALLGSTANGMLSWRPDDKNSTLSALPLKYSGLVQFGIHPNLPVLFATVTSHVVGDSFFRVGQVEGYLSLLPRQYMLEGAKFSGTPAIVNKTNKLAIGGHYFVYVYQLDDKGLPQPNGIQIQVLNPNTRALVYSEKFDRVYVGVDASK